MGYHWFHCWDTCQNIVDEVTECVGTWATYGDCMGSPSDLGGCEHIEHALSMILAAYFEYFDTSIEATFLLSRMVL